MKICKINLICPKSYIFQNSSRLEEIQREQTNLKIAIGNWEEQHKFAAADLLQQSLDEPILTGISRLTDVERDFITFHRMVARKLLVLQNSLTTIDFLVEDELSTNKHHGVSIDQLSKDGDNLSNLLLKSMPVHETDSDSAEDFDEYEYKQVPSDDDDDVAGMLRTKKKNDDKCVIC